MRRAADLAAAGLIGESDVAALDTVGARYAIALTPVMAELIDHGDASDPIARQFIPSVAELKTHPAEVADPIGDKAHSPVPGLVHRYPDRVLLKVASVCPVYCRFCFRREMIGPELGEAMSEQDVDTALAYVRAHPEIWEVILTGGDPLVLSPRRIASLTRALDTIPHVKVLRWHTRVPVVDPERITDELVAALTAGSKPVYVGLHTNHVRELAPAARAAIGRLTCAGLTLVSQTVLLKGVNDSADALEDLFRDLVTLKVKPYYLHHGDLAPGTSHFRTTIAAGNAIMAELRGRLSGLAMPTYVLDIPGGFGKVPVDALTRAADGRSYEVRDRHGRIHRYEDSAEDTTRKSKVEINRG